MSEILKKLLRIVGIVTISIMLFIGIMQLPFLREYFYPIRSIFSIEIIIMIGTAFLAVFIGFYLQSGYRSGHKKEHQIKDDAFFQQKHMFERILMRAKETNNELIEEVKNFFESQQKKEVELTTSEKEKLLRIIEDKIEASVVEKIMDTFQDKYSEAAFIDNKYKEIVHDIFEIKRRLYNEISKLTLRANVNLAIGAATTIFAIAILWLTVVSQISDFSNMETIVFVLIPRISLVIFIEVFAFFFLKMYKSNLSDIKYYHNEMTNCDFKILALKTAFAKNDETEIDKIINSFITVERNFILKKGETTVEIEKDKSDSNQSNKLINIIKDIVAAKR